MKNWSTDTSKLQKAKEKFLIWRLERLIHFGLNEEKIDINELRKYWNVLSMDPAKRSFYLFLYESTRESS